MSQWLSSKFLGAVRTVEAGHQCAVCRTLDLHIGVKGREHRREGRGIRVLDVEGLEDETLWC